MPVEQVPPAAQTIVAQKIAGRTTVARMIVVRTTVARKTAARTIAVASLLAAGGSPSLAVAFHSGQRSFAAGSSNESASVRESQSRAPARISLEGSPRAQALDRVHRPPILSCRIAS